MFASYANCTGLNFVSPHMLTAQDLAWFASYANCTGLNLVTSVWTYRRLPVWLRFEVLWKIKICLLSPRRSFWSFYQVHDPFSFCIHTSDRKTCIWCSMSCNVWCVWMKCLCIGFNFMFFFSSNLPPSCPCILCRLVGVVPFSPVLGDFSISILACRIVSYSSFLETEHSCSIL